jgi:hypothetical protein
MSSTSKRFLALAAPLALGAMLYGTTAAADTTVVVAGSSSATQNAGADLHIHNHTGSDVEVYVFEDEKVHKSRAGGVHSGDLKNGETGTAHVKACHFSVVLFHGDDAYHSEFKDCSITDINITAANH